MAKKKNKIVEPVITEAIVIPQVDDEPVGEEKKAKTNKKEKRETHHGKIWCVLPQYGISIALDFKDGKYYTIQGTKYKKDQEIDFQRYFIGA